MMEMFMKMIIECDEKRRIAQEERDEQTNAQMMAIIGKIQDGKNSEQKPDLYKRIEPFVHNPEQGLTFMEWIGRFEMALQSVSGATWPNAEKRATLAMKLGPKEYTILRDDMLPRTLEDLSYEETKTHLEKLFGDKKSLQAKRFDFENIRNTGPAELPIAYGARVRRLCNEARWETYSKEMSMCLHFIWGLNDEQYGNAKHKLLQKAEQECTLEELMEETQKVRLSQKPCKIQEVVAEVKHFRNNSRDFPSKEDREIFKRKGPCFHCRKMGHYAATCSNLVQQVKKNNTMVAANRRYTTVKFGEVEVRMQLDSGADVTLIDIQTWVKIGSPELSKPVTTIGAANGTEIEVVG